MKKNRKRGIRLLAMLLIVALTAGSGMLSAPFAMEARAQEDENHCMHGNDGKHYWDVYERIEPNCTRAGSIRYLCRNGCGFEKQDSLPALGHAWDGGTVTKSATCTEDGVKTLQCTRCNETGTEAIPKTDHTWDGGKVTKEANCTEKGIRSFSCTHCGMQRTEDIPAKGHSPLTVPGKAATCTEKGLTDGQSCSVCGAVLQAQTEIAALDHDWDAGKEREVQGTGARLLACKEIVYTCRRDASHTKTEKVDVSATEVMSRLRSRGLKGRAPVAEPLVITQQPKSGTLPFAFDYELRVQVSGGVKPYRYVWYMVNDGSKEDPGKSVSLAKASLSAKASGIRNRVGNTPVREAENAMDIMLPGSNSPVYRTNTGEREYYCVIRDAAGQCVITDKVRVYGRVRVLDVKGSDGQNHPVKMENGEATLVVTATGGCPFEEAPYYRYEWEEYYSKTTISAEDESLTVTKPGHYLVTVYDANGEYGTNEGATVYDDDKTKDLYVKTLTEDVILSPGESTELRFEVGGGNAELGRTIMVYTQRVSDFKPFVYNGTVPEPQVVDPEDPDSPVIQSLNITASIPNEMRGYFLVVYDRIGRTVQSDMIVVRCGMKIKTQPVGGVIGEGETHTLSIEMESGKEPYTYRLLQTDSRWLKTQGYEEVETQTGGSSASFTVDKTGRYYINVTDADGLFVQSDPVTVESAVFRIRDYSPQQGEFQFPDGSTKTGFRVEVEGGEAPYTFHWEKVYATDGRSWYGRDERTAFQYTSAAQEEPVGLLEMHTPGLYSCTVTDATGASATVEEMEYRYAGDAPYITIQPRMKKIRTGRSGTEKYTFYCDAVGSKGDDSTLYFRWFKFDSETMAGVVYAGSGKYYTPSKTDSPNTVYYCSVWDEATDRYTQSIECGFVKPMQITTAAQRGTGDSIDVVVTGGAAPYQVEAVRVVRDPLSQVQTGSTGKPIEFNAMRFLQKYELLPGGGCGFTLAGIDRYRTNKESGQKEAYTYIIRVKDATGATVTQEVTCKW